MGDKQTFNSWADSYNEDVRMTQEKGEYPFAGYKETIQLIVDYVDNNKPETIVEMGIGTGFLSKKLYDKGHFIIGVDFSEKMIDHAFSIMPNAKFINTDFRNAINYLEPESISCYIFSYAIHHLTPYSQYQLLRDLQKTLKKDGKIIIGDVMRRTPEELKQLEQKYKHIWDTDEHYPTQSDYKKNLYDAYNIYHVDTSHCAGVIVLEKNTD